MTISYKKSRVEKITLRQTYLSYCTIRTKGDNKHTADNNCSMNSKCFYSLGQTRLHIGTKCWCIWLLSISPLRSRLERRSRLTRDSQLAQYNNSRSLSSWRLFKSKRQDTLDLYLFIFLELQLNLIISMESWYKKGQQCSLIRLRHTSTQKFILNRMSSGPTGG